MKQKRTDKYHTDDVWSFKSELKDAILFILSIGVVYILTALFS